MAMDMFRIANHNARLVATSVQVFLAIRVVVRVSPVLITGVTSG